MSVDANIASRAELVALAGIGNERADAIIAARPFNSIEDLISIPGVGERVLKKLVNQGLTVARRREKERNMEDREINMPAGEMSAFEDDGHSPLVEEMGAVPDEQMGKVLAAEMPIASDDEMAMSLDEEMAHPSYLDIDMNLGIPRGIVSGQELGMAIAESAQAVELSGDWRLTFSVRSLKSSEDS